MQFWKKAQCDNSLKYWFCKQDNLKGNYCKKGKSICRQMILMTCFSVFTKLNTVLNGTAQVNEWQWHRIGIWWKWYWGLPLINWSQPPSSTSEAWLWYQRHSPQLVLVVCITSPFQDFSRWYNVSEKCGLECSVPQGSVIGPRVPTTYS